tara:strand:+ start:306 stop:524 length:219 start_codon:yes stop_codon:yes gene_type:complete
VKIGDLVRVHPKLVPAPLREKAGAIAGLIGVVVECVDPTIRHPAQIVAVNFGEGIVEDYYSTQIELLSETEE